MAANDKALAHDPRSHGGTAHVVALGVFVLLASRTPGFGEGVRGFAWVVAVPAVGVTRGLSRGTWPPARGPRSTTVLSTQGES
ncbi:hypothetical protein [Actinomadura sp. 3N407]|uniref:hypothetical protein n=1 Tax=Actinomadura sp. 3N407 TaxID=3457423 RepID=UPI003FCCF520